MKHQALRQLLQQNCPLIHHLEADSPEAFEGECSLWERDDCTIIIDLPPLFSGSLNQVAEIICQRLNWLQDHRNMILDTVLADNHISGSLKKTTDNPAALGILYAAFFVETEQEIYCDFALCAENSTHCLELSLEADCTLLINGWGEPL